MPTVPVTLNFDSTILPTAANALAWKGGYQPTITNADGTTSPNPVTKNQFAKQQLIAYVMNCIADYQAMQAQQAVVAPDSSLIS